MTISTRTPLRPRPARARRRALTAVTIVAVAAVLAAGCGDDDTATPATTTTTVPGPSTTTTGGDDLPDLAGLASWISCGDATIVFATPDDTAIVRVEVPALLARAEEEGGPFTIDFDLADDAGATATLETGTALGITACNDVPDPGYDVAGSWTADQGTVTISAAEVPAGPLEVCVTPLDVTVTIEGVAVPVDGTTIVVPDLTHEGAIGWCPG